MGGYYLDMTWDTFQSVQGALILGGTSDTQKMSTFGDIDSKNWSAFGQVEFDLASQWTLVTGLRWSQDNKSVTDKALEDAMQKQSWDPSVKALTSVPQVLQMMNDKLEWVRSLAMRSSPRSRT